MKPARGPKEIDAALARLLAPFGDHGLEGLLQTAVELGMLITPDRRQRLYLLAWRLAEAGIEFDDAKDAAVTFGSVLCATAEDQAGFERELERRWSSKSPGLKGLLDEKRDKSPDAPPTSTARVRALFSSRPLLFAAIGVAVIAALGLVVWYVGARSGVIYVPDPPKVGSDGSESANLLAAAAHDLLQRAMVALPGLIGAWLAWTWWRPMTSVLSREQGSADRLEQFTRPDLNTLFRGTTTRLAFDTLRRAVRTQSSKVDVRSSLRETVRAAGWPTIRRATQRNSLEVILFVDREGAADHLAFLAQLLEDRLRAAGATVTRYDFRITPTRLTQVSGRPDGAAVEDVERIVARHVGQRLILIGDGRGLVEGDDLDDELRLRRLLGEFAQVHVLTPTPENCWEERERRLLMAGFNVAFCDRDGIEDSARISTLVDWTEPLAATLRNIGREPDPFLAHLEREYHRYAVDYPVLQPAAGAPDGPIATAGLSALQIRALVSALLAWTGSRPAFRLLVAIAVFPSVKPGYTLAIADALSQDAESPCAALDEKLYARLARLPWLRDGRFPDWLRLALVRRLTESEREAMARAHIKLLAPMAVAHGTIVAQASLEIARKSLSANMDPDHPLAERLFLAMLFGQAPKADLLRPHATAEIAEALGGQRKQAPRLVAAGFLVAAVLCFLLKDDVVFPALITAGEWLTRVVAPLLPGDLVAEVARYSAIACSVIALVSLGRLSPGAASPEANTTFGMLHSRTLARSLRLTIGVSGVVLSVLGLASSDTTMLPASAFLFSTVVVARLLFELHPACNGEIWITPDVDQAATNEGTTLSKYSLADAIVSGRMVGPTLGGTLLAAIFLGTMAGAGAFMFDRPNANDTLAFAIALLSIQTIGFTVFALAARRIVLGTWILRTSPRYSRHVFFDLLSGGIAASIALLIFSTRDLHTSPVAAFIPFAMTAAVSSFLLISALGLRPFARPRAKHGTLRANLAIPLLIAITSFFGVTSVAVAAKQLSPLWKTGLLIAAFCLQYAASCAFVPLDQSLALRDRFRGAAKGVWSAKKRLLPAVTILLIAVSGIVGNFGLRGGDEDLLIATSCSLLIWPLFRWFGAVPLIEELKARETDTTVVTKPVAPWWTYLDTPWWATIILSGLLLPHWEAAGLPQWVDSNMLFAVPPICIAFAYRYGTAAAWPVAVGLLPHVIMISGFIFDLHGSPGFVVAMLFWVRFVADPALRRSLLARETLPLLDLLTLAFALSFTVYIYLEGLFVFQYGPDWLVMTVALVIGLSRMPAWRFLLLLAVLTIAREATDLTFSLLGPPPPAGPQGGQRALPTDANLQYGLPWTTAVAAALVTLLTRTCLRRSMIADDQRAALTEAGSQQSSGLRTVLAAKLPLVLFTILQAGWMVGRVLDEGAFVLDTFVSHGPVVAVTGLMLGLTAVHAFELMVIPAIVLATQLLTPFLIRFLSVDVTIFPAVRFVEFTASVAFVALVYAGYMALGMAVRMFAEGRWSMSLFWSTSQRVLRWILPLFPFRVSRAEPKVASAAAAAEPMDIGSDLTSEPDEQSESAPGPNPPRRGPTKKAARKPGKK